MAKARLSDFHLMTHKYGYELTVDGRGVFDVASILFTPSVRMSVHPSNQQDIDV